MGDRYYDNPRRSQDSYRTTEYYSPRSSQRGQDYEDFARRSSRDFSPSREVVQYNVKRDRDDTYYDSPRDADYEHPRRHRSVSPPRSRRGSEHHQHRHHHEGSHRHSEEHHPGKDIAATLLGAVAGGEVGRKAGGEHRGMATAAGVLIGAFGGHEIEKKWEDHEDKEKRKSYDRNGGR